MGVYINAGNENLKMALNSQIFVDKSLILQRLCSLLNSNQRFICVSRPRRFGKTTVRDLMVAYFSKGCDSKALFSNFAECENWYDGYKIGEFDIYNPNSVVRAMTRKKYTNYWNATGSYEVVSDYIRLDFDGTKSAITEMLAGNDVKVNVKKFKNKLSEIKNKDNVLTYRPA